MATNVVDIDRMDAMLSRLKLTAIRDQLDSLLDEAARADLSARETLGIPRPGQHSGGFTQNGKVAEGAGPPLEIHQVGGRVVG